MSCWCWCHQVVNLIFLSFDTVHFILAVTLSTMIFVNTMRFMVTVIFVSAVSTVIFVSAVNTMSAVRFVVAVSAVSATGGSSTKRLSLVRVHILHVGGVIGRIDTGVAQTLSHLQR